MSSVVTSDPTRVTAPEVLGHIPARQLYSHGGSPLPSGWLYPSGMQRPSHLLYTRLSNPAGVRGGVTSSHPGYVVSPGDGERRAALLRTSLHRHMCHHM